MAGTTIDRQLTASVSGGVRFILADERHDCAIRRLLRDNPISGEVTLTLEREPDYFLGSRLPGVLEDQTLLALQGDRVVCIGGCSVRERYINGRCQRVGYLGGLRLDHSVQGRFDIVRRGYKFFAEIAQDRSTEYYFTSITSDNLRSIRLLERGLPGMPSYRFLSEFVTLLIPIADRVLAADNDKKALRNLEERGLRYSRGSEKNAGQLAEFLNSCGQEIQLATHWTKDDLLRLADFGLPITDFHILEDNEIIVAAVALWDQRSFGQTVIRSYNRRLSLLRPWINGASRIFGTPHLPKTNSILEHAFVSPCATIPEHHSSLPDLIHLCLPAAATRGIKFLTLGFGSLDTRLEHIRAAFRCREYRSRLYRVAWSGESLALETLDKRSISPEVAFL
jgi:hypothetical protein